MFHRITKLPKWAQEYVSALRTERDSAVKALEARSLDRIIARLE